MSNAQDIEAKRTRLAQLRALLEDTRIKDERSIVHRSPHMRARIEELEQALRAKEEALLTALKKDLMTALEEAAYETGRVAGLRDDQLDEYAAGAWLVVEHQMKDAGGDAVDAWVRAIEEAIEIQEHARDWARRASAAR